ncbi:hypothetical protein, partial [Bacillus paranthracis]|uniref:hypothetical protein n=1 Tax=Bacillus paranthracis TaxID=2026186 RepID=UPI002852AE0B
LTQSLWISQVPTIYDFTISLHDFCPFAVSYTVDLFFPSFGNVVNTNSPLTSESITFGVNGAVNTVLHVLVKSS